MKGFDKAGWSAVTAALGLAAPLLGHVVQALIGIVLVVWGARLVLDVFSPDAEEHKEALQIIVEPDSGSTGKVGASILGNEDKELLSSRGFMSMSHGDHTRWEKFRPANGAGFHETEVLIAREGQIIVHGSMFDIHRECGWRSGEYRRLEYENGSACDFNALMRRAKYQERLSQATNLVFVGLESFPKSSVAEGCEGNLSKCRFEELFKRTYEAMPDKWVGRRYWGIDLGRHTVDDPILEFDQRKALVFAIRDFRSELSIQEAVKVLLVSSHVGGVQLDEYELANSSTPVEIEKPL